jgi:transcriptional regulator with XRE-family HTH domain
VATISTQRILSVKPIRTPDQEGAQRRVLNRIAAARRICRSGPVPQADLARRVGLSARQLRRIEKGESTPSVDLFVRIARELGVSAALLLAPEADRAGSVTGYDTASSGGGARDLRAPRRLRVR